MRKVSTIVFIVFTVALISSCESSLRRSLEINAKYDDVFIESVQAVNDIGYRLVSADKESGLITGGRQSSTSSNIVVDLNVTVKRVQSGVELKVAFLPRSAVLHIGFEGVEEEFRDYTESLRKKFPSIKIN